MKLATHRGIKFTIARIREDEWIWEIRPPSSVTGWERASGRAWGTASDATKAATREIERQALRHLN